MSANSLTTAIVQYLTLKGFVAWRQNNGAVFSRERDTYLKNPNHKKGIPDVMGFCKKTARIIAVEVKIGKDKLSEEQEQFLDAVTRAGGIAFVAKTYDQFEEECKKLKIV